MKTSPLNNDRFVPAVMGESNLCLLSVLLFFSFLMVACENQEELSPAVDENAAFLSFTTNGQTLPTIIRKGEHIVKLEVDHDIDLSSLTPSFEIPAGYTVFANGKAQQSGISKIDLSKSVTYELKDKNNLTTSWTVAAVPLRCKIIIDASHDGGVWWYPQYEATGFNSSLPHQGQAFADFLRAKGFEVTELGRGTELTDEMFFGNYIIIRAGGFQAYTQKELDVYTRLIERGTNLVFFTDHKKFDPVDELGDHLGLQFKGAANGKVNKFASHEITANLESIDYIAGSVITNANQNPDIQVLGWLDAEDYTDLNFNGVKDANEPTGSPVMGILDYPKSRIFFIGDMNGLEVQPQPFIDNLIQWMGHCFVD